MATVRALRAARVDEAAVADPPGAGFTLSARNAVDDDVQEAVEEQPEREEEVWATFRR